MKTNLERLKSQILETMPPLLRKVETRLLDEVYGEFREALRRNADGLGNPSLPQIAEQFSDFLMLRVQETLQSIRQLHQQHEEFTTSIQKATDEDERRSLILDFARTLGQTSRGLRGDTRAFKRWFGLDTVQDRFRSTIARMERRTLFFLRCLGSALRLTLEAAHDAPEAVYAARWRHFDLESFAEPLITYSGDSRVRIAILDCVAEAIQAIPEGHREGLVSDRIIRFVYRCALETTQPVWLQCASLDLLNAISAASVAEAIEKRLTNPREGDDLFVRRRAAALLGENLKRTPLLCETLPAALRDPSPYVRQTLATALRRQEEPEAAGLLRQLVVDDPVSQVRAAAVCEAALWASGSPLQETGRAILLESLQRESDPFVLRAAMLGAEQALDAVMGSNEVDVETWYAEVRGHLELLHRESEHLPVRRWAAQTRERLWCAHDPQARRLRDTLIQSLAGLRPGEDLVLSGKTLRGVPESVLGRVLSALGLRTYGYDARREWFGRWRIRPAFSFDFQAWRFLHEMARPSPDKRQGISHAVGRSHWGRLQAPSAIMAELSETKVPGEPLCHSSEGGWRPYLPTIDHLLSALRPAIGAKPTRIYTSEGVTEVLPPRWASLRAVSWLWLTVRYARYAGLRNWHETGTAAPSAYVRALRNAKIRIRFQPHEAIDGKPDADPSVTRFFGAFIPYGSLWPRFKEYFFSVYQNTALELAVFAGAATAYFVGRHLFLSYRMRAIRRQLPLVIGGWGTRGKSSVERLKAALINAIGYGVISKTTGCEAMFLYAPPCGTLRELPIFRPYDKATIWEQYNIAKLASRLRADVMLWECMALSPAYARVLQHDWMRDDCSTITNAYPDHEDIQGPAGFNIPEALSSFVPRHGTLVTAEEQMLPILEAAAKKNRTRLIAPGWLEAGLIPPDLMARFSYEEHPHNIALVLKLAEELGIPADFAVKEMADRVIPDIGVLKQYPIARAQGRRINFVNGMSANERFGCLSNWQRVGFARHTPEEEPGVWISTVVNNRADRVARSQVFADILAQDLSADRHFLIGTNITGLMGFVRAAWTRHAATLNLWPKGIGDPHPLETLETQARWMRVPSSEAEVKTRLRAMLQGIEETAFNPEWLEAWNDPKTLREYLVGDKTYAPYTDGILRALEVETAAWREYEALARQIAETGDRRHAALERRFRETLGMWFERKFVVLSDPHISGEAIIQQIIENTPPGYFNRVMGIQNIKGAGMDFVYRWEAWARCHAACAMATQKDPTVAKKGLQQLTAFLEYGLLAEEHVLETLERVRHSSHIQSERVQAEIAIVESNLKRTLAEVRQKLRRRARTSVLTFVLGFIESFLDAGDAVRRRKTADRICSDLVEQRISQDRAVIELRAIDDRQKGGWLRRQVSEAIEGLRGGEG